MHPRFRDLLFALCALTVLCPLSHAQQLATTNTASPTLTSPADAAKKMIANAIDKMNAKTPDVDGAINDLSQAIKANPNSTGAYVLRASLYCQKKLWPQAEADFQAAAKIAPTNVVLKFNLVEIKFLQKQYDAARPGFLALEKDPDMGDFADMKTKPRRNSMCSMMLWAPLPTISPMPPGAWRTIISMRRAVGFNPLIGFIPSAKMPFTRKPSMIWGTCRSLILSSSRSYREILTQWGWLPAWRRHHPVWRIRPEGCLRRQADGRLRPARRLVHPA